MWINQSFELVIFQYVENIVEQVGADCAAIHIAEELEDSMDDRVVLRLE